MSYFGEIHESLMKLKPNMLFSSNEIYRNKFSHIPEPTFYKTLARMNAKKEISRLSTGLYYVPKKSRYGALPLNQNEILNQYLGKKHNKGILIGYRLYNKYQLTTQIGKSLELYSNVVEEEKKVINNTNIFRTDLKLNPTRVNIIEILEILENYAKIEDMNPHSFKRYISNAIKSYENQEALEVMRKIKYKKSTIAFLASILNYFSINNTLGSFLSTLSSYKIPKIEDIYEFA
jgi:hypothetical protein